MNSFLSPTIHQGESGGFASEVKFTVAPSLAAQIREWARANMAADPHGAGPFGDAYNIESLYLDTENFDVLLRNGSFGRGKYRIRRYGTNDVVFLERKMKKHGLVSKMRTEVPLSDIEHIAEPQPDRRWPGFWFHRRILVRGLKPVCQVRYARTARIAASPNGALRLTLDDAISVHRANGFAFESQLDPADFSRDRVILELKFRQQVPPLFQNLIEEFQLERQPASKYRIAGAMLGFAAPRNDESGFAPRPHPNCGEPLCLTS
jgi:hypothetical protein